MTADEDDAQARWHNLAATDPGTARMRDHLLRCIFVTVLFATLLGLIGGKV